MRAAALGVVTLAVVGACAVRQPRGVPPGAPAMVDARGGSPAMRDAGASPPDDDVSLDALAARAASLAPGMREEVRVEAAVAQLPAPLVRAASGDACARVVYAASESGRAWLEDAHGTTLAEASGRTGALPARGPVCVRRGDTVALRFEGTDAARIRVVAWVSP